MMTSTSKTMNIISVSVLIIVCVGTLFLAVPTMRFNIDNPNMIVYFDADEGGMMDVAWWYYSGVKRDTFQWEFDYGLEMHYLADMARGLSKWINFTPGTFVLILRWLHLLSWIGALIALWYFVGYHFGKGWQQAIAVLLLATRDAFAYFMANLKPEPLVLLLMIMGLHYSLKIVKDPSWRNLIIATALASLAFITKFAGAFLLTAIVFAMYFSRFRTVKNNDTVSYPTLNAFWALPAVLGVGLMVLPILILTFYVRKSTGTTWVQDLGLWGSLTHNKLGLYAVAAGACGIGMSIVLYLMAGAKNTIVNKIMGWIKEMSSYALISLGMFGVFTVIFGFGWILNPKLFITTYAFLGTSGPVSESLATIPQSSFVYVFFHHMVSQINKIDPAVVLLFAAYLIVEAYSCLKRDSFRDDRIRALKRFTLLAFLIPAFACIFAPMRLAAHHMLPFFVAISVLSLQGVEMILSSLKNKKTFFYIALVIISVLLLSDIAANGSSLIRKFVYRYGQGDDIAYDIASWWRVNMPKDAVIVAEEHNRCYIPEGYKNIMIFKSSPRNGDDRLRELIIKHHPEYIYYNAGQRNKDEEMSPIERIVPEFKFIEAASFDSSTKRYEKLTGARYVIYKVTYDQGAAR